MAAEHDIHEKSGGSGTAALQGESNAQASQKQSDHGLVERSCVQGIGSDKSSEESDASECSLPHVSGHQHPFGVHAQPGGAGAAVLSEQGTGNDLSFAESDAFEGSQATHGSSHPHAQEGVHEQSGGAGAAGPEEADVQVGQDECDIEEVARSRVKDIGDDTSVQSDDSERSQSSHVSGPPRAHELAMARAASQLQAGRTSLALRSLASALGAQYTSTVERSHRQWQYRLTFSGRIRGTFDDKLNDDHSQAKRSAELEALRFLLSLLERHSASAS